MADQQPEGMRPYALSTLLREFGINGESLARSVRCPTCRAASGEPCKPRNYAEGCGLSGIEFEWGRRFHPYRWRSVPDALAIPAVLDGLDLMESRDNLTEEGKVRIPMDRERLTRRLSKIREREEAKRRANRG